MTTHRGLASGFAARLWTMMALALLLGTPAVQAQTAVVPSAGTGTQANPWQISVLGNLVWMSANVATANGYYKLMNDVDASPTASWSGGFPPIGNGSALFGSYFDGNGKKITGLRINRPATDNVGLFGHIGSHAEVRNLALVGGTVAGHTNVGSLVGITDSGTTITNCYATGTVTGSGTDIGGLVGYAEGTYGAITNCHTGGAVTGTGAGGGIGGLIGCIGLFGNFDKAMVSDSYASGAVTGTGTGTTYYVGGLIGRIEFDNGGLLGGTIRNCYATGAVRSFAGRVGGLVGFGGSFGGIIADCHATGSVSGLDSVGGLVGWDFGNSISKCYATGAVTGSNNVGGLTGGSWSAVTDCYATGAVAGDSGLGGLVGDLGYSVVTNCYAAGRVSGTSGLGGLVGVSDSPCTVTSCYWDLETSAISLSAGGVGKTTAQMKQQATFVGWDFATIWGIVENVTYPFLRSVPSAPSNVSPGNGAAGVVPTPTLTASAFSDLVTTCTHAASQWQVRAATSPSSWTLTVFDSGTDATALTSCPVPPGVLVWLTDYWWRVCYEDNQGGWSVWSAPTSFQTAPQPTAPMGVAASDGAFSDRVRVVWAGAAGDANYMVYRSTHSTTATTTALTGWVVGTAYDDLTAERGIIYYYWVRAAADATGGSASGLSACDSGWAGAGVPFPSNYRGTIWIVR